MKKERTLEAMLVISTGFLLLFLIYGKVWLLFISFGAGLAGIFIKPLAFLVAKGWFKLGELLGFVVSKLVLSVMFFILLVPISFLYRIFNKDTLRLKKSEETFWFHRNHQFEPTDLKNIW